MCMEITTIYERGYTAAMRGLSLSHNKDENNMHMVAQRLASKDGGHNKFLETIVVWLNIRAPRYFWQEFDTYRVGVTKQSESTMHTLLKRALTLDDFEKGINPSILTYLNKLLKAKQFHKLKVNLPEGFLQRRIVCTNYKTLRNIICQRKNHKLKEWKYFCEYIISNVAFPDLLGFG